MARPCPGCGCTDAPGEAVHGMRAALAEGDLDRALGLGLLDAAPCAGCAPACTRVLLDSRDARRAALAARERYRARQQRLERRARMRESARAGSAPSPAPHAGAPQATSSPPATPALPAAAAAALARAKARASKSAPNER